MCQCRASQEEWHRHLSLPSYLRLELSSQSLRPGLPTASVDNQYCRPKLMESGSWNSTAQCRHSQRRISCNICSSYFYVSAGPSTELRPTLGSKISNEEKYTSGIHHPDATDHHEENQVASPKRDAETDSNEAEKLRFPRRIHGSLS